MLDCTISVYGTQFPSYAIQESHEFDEQPEMSIQQKKKKKQRSKPLILIRSGI